MFPLPFFQVGRISGEKSSQIVSPGSASPPTPLQGRIISYRRRTILTDDKTILYLGRMVLTDDRMILTDDKIVRT